MTNLRAFFLTLALLGVCAATFSASPAHAEPNWIIKRPSNQQRLTDLSFGLGFHRHHDLFLAPGIMLGIPLVDGGFIRPINDSFFLEPGLFIGFWRHDGRDKNGDGDDDTDIYAIPEVGPRWNFYLTPNWDVFGAVKLGWRIGEDSDFWVRATAGMQWWFSRPWALRLETHGGRRLGPGMFLGLSYEFR